MLLPGFSLLAHASAIEPLQMANQLSGHMLYHTVTLSLDDEPVRSGAQLSLLAQHTLSAPLGPMDLLFICAPTPLPYALPAKLNEWLRSHQGRGVAFGGLAGGTEVLARCGLLEGYLATLPWQRFDAFASYGFNFIPKAGLLYSSPVGTFRATYGKGIAAPGLRGQFDQHRRMVTG